MINKLIKLVSKVGKERELNTLIQSMIALSQAEQGCVKYDAYVDSDNSTTIYLIEEWENEESLNLHKEAPHFVNFKKLAPELLEDKGSISLDKM